MDDVHQPSSDLSSITFQAYIQRERDEDFLN